MSMFKKILYTLVSMFSCFLFLYFFPNMNFSLKLYFGLILMGGFNIFRPRDWNDWSS